MAVFTVFIILLGGLFGLMLLSVPLGFSLSFVSILVLTQLAELPSWMFMQRFHAGLSSFVLIAIPFFLLTGQVMNRSGLTDRLIDLAYAMVGHIKGGLAHVNVIVSMLFAGISGSAVADTGGVGAILIPAMTKRGYTASFAVAVTAASSTLGQIIPPSIIMIVYASVTGSSVGALFLAGAIPGLMIGLSQMALAYGFAIKYNYPSEERTNWPKFWTAFKRALAPLAIPIIIIGGVVTGVFTATESSVIAALYSLFLGVIWYRSLSLRDVYDIFLQTAKMSSLTLFCIGGAGIFGWLLGYFQVSGLIADVFVSLSAGNPYVLLLAAVALFLVLGTFMDAVPAIIIFMPIIHPIASRVGIDPIHMGIVVVVTLAFGLVTPPYGLCLLLASSIAKIPASKALRDVLIFLAVILVILVIILFLPGLILFLPRMLM